jgi:hypothetical protein
MPAILDTYNMSLRPAFRYDDVRKNKNYKKN